MATGKRERGTASRAVAAEIKAERMKKKMSDSSLTQKRVAETSGVPVNTLKSIETGRSPIDVDQLFALADALEIKPSTIVMRAEEEMAGGNTVVPIPAPGGPTAPRVDYSSFDESEAARDEDREKRQLGDA